MVAMCWAAEMFCNSSLVFIGFVDAKLLIQYIVFVLPIPSAVGT